MRHQMKRFFKIGIAVLLLAALASCASDKNGEDTETTAGETTNSAETTLETVFDYENSDISGMGNSRPLTEELAAAIESALLTEEEFESAIDNMLSGYAHYEKIAARAVEEGDTVICDYSGYLDGTQFERRNRHGRDNNSKLRLRLYPRICGRSFVGQMPGVEFSFNVTFPEDYGHDELNGKEVTFKATVKYINGEHVTPELTDEFVKENFSGYTNCSGVENSLPRNCRAAKAILRDKPDVFRPLDEDMCQTQRSTPIPKPKSHAFTTKRKPVVRKLR